MVQVIEQTDVEKLAMYMKLSKKELASMLIQCNKIINARPVQVEFYPAAPYQYVPNWPYQYPPLYPTVTTSGNIPES